MPTCPMRPRMCTTFHTLAEHGTDPINDGRIEGDRGGSTKEQAIGGERETLVKQLVQGREEERKRGREREKKRLFLPLQSLYFPTPTFIPCFRLSNHEIPNLATIFPSFLLHDITFDNFFLLSLHSLLAFSLSLQTLIDNTRGLSLSPPPSFPALRILFFWFFSGKMSDDSIPKKSYSHQPLPNSLSDRFHNALSCENNKPDFKELDLGSPVSPLRTRLSGPSSSLLTTTTTSSSSSSSGSVTGKTAANVAAATGKRSDGGSHSGELDGGSSEGSPTAAESGRSGRGSRPGHLRSNSGGAPLIYSGISSSASSPIVGCLPTGNICPSGRILKTGMACKARSDVLGSGTVNYGHGSIMRGPVKSGADVAGPTSVTGNIHLAGESVMVKRGMASSDPEEVKRIGNEQYKRGNFAEALSLYDRAIAMSPDNAACRSNRAAALIGLGRLADAVRECEEALRLDPAYGRAHHRLGSLLLR